MTLAAGDAVGTYRLVEQLGTGGMGEVWAAEHVVLRRPVAIKFLRAALSQQPEMVERFFDEARAATQIVDPGIVQVHDFGDHDGATYIVMERLIGESLSTRLARAVRLPVGAAVRLAQQAALTMSIAHDRGIVHRDLKPDNLFVIADAAVAGGERIKILDFGIAKLLAEPVTTTRTQSGAILGTPMYMSPEQCRGAGGVDHRTDIYGLGCVLFHLVTGRPPFIAGSTGDMIAAHLLEPPPRPGALVTAVPPELDAVIGRCLAKPAAERYASMAELAAALAPTIAMMPTPPPGPRVADSRGLALAPTAAAPAAAGAILVTTLGTSAGESRAERPRPPPRHRGRIVVAVVVVGAIVAGGVVWGLKGTPDEPTGALPPLPDAQADARPEARVDARPDAQPDARPEAPIDARPDARPRTRRPRERDDPYADRGR